MLWVLWQIFVGILLIGLTTTLAWLVTTRRLLQKRRGWVWGYFRSWPLRDPTPNDILGMSFVMAMVGIAQGIGSVLMWLGLACALVMLAMSILRAWQLR